MLHGYIVHKESSLFISAMAAPNQWVEDTPMDKAVSLLLFFKLDISLVILIFLPGEFVQLSAK